jgi:RNA polymerase sigma-70 factor (ECF subfamily)
MARLPSVPAEAESAITSKIEARWASVIEEHGRFLRRTIARICPNNRGLQFDDIEQEVRLRLWRAIQSEREITDLASYIYRAAANATLDAIRHLESRREDPVESGTEAPGPRRVDEESPERLAGRRLLVARIQETLSRLPEKRRCALELYLQGFTTEEIAELLSWSEPKARNLVYRGLHELRDRLRAEGIDYEVD